MGRVRRLSDRAETKRTRSWARQGSERDSLNAGASSYEDTRSERWRVQLRRHIRSWARQGSERRVRC